jgi:hypothetical protein
MVETRTDSEKLKGIWIRWRAHAANPVRMHLLIDNRLGVPGAVFESRYFYSTLARTGSYCRRKYLPYRRFDKC